MVDDVDALIAWAFDPERFDPERQMWDYVESRRDDLLSDDTDISELAAEEVSAMFKWLLMPRTASDVSQAISEEQEKVRAKMKAAGFPEHLINAAVRSVRVRQRGRPRDRNLDAIAGLRMYWRERKSWREIVRELNGTCKERNCPSFCPDCGDVRRKKETGVLGYRRSTVNVCRSCRFRVRPPEQKESVCFKCADRMAELVRRLEAFLEERGIRPPRKLLDHLRE